MKTNLSTIFILILGMLFSVKLNSQNSSLLKNNIYQEIPQKQFIYSFIDNVTEESALKLDNFFMSKKGITHCITDVKKKTTVITLNETFDKKFIDEMYENAEHRFFVKK